MNWSYTLTPSPVAQYANTAMHLLLLLFFLTISPALNAQDSSLSELSIDAWVLEPSFNPEVDEYTVEVADATEQVTVYAIASTATARIEINNVELQDSSSAVVSLAQSTAVIRVRVTAPDDTRIRTYRLIVTRPAASSGNPSAYDSDGDRFLEISNLEQLSAIRYDLNGDGVPESNANVYLEAFPDALMNMEYSSVGYVGYELTKDLDFATTNSYVEGAINTEWREGQGWSPIGSAQNGQLYNAQFEGNGYQIANLYISRSEVGLGLFSGIGGEGVVHDIGIVSAEVRGGEVAGDYGEVGILAGVNQGLIKESYTSGAVSAMEHRAGGLVGNNSGVVILSRSSADVNSDRVYIGGLIGSNSQAGTISSSYATGDVMGLNYTGGLAGANFGAVSASYAAGDVSGWQLIGGLIGSNSGVVSVSYATGGVSGSGDNIGGLVGNNSQAGTISSSYATGGVSTGKRNVGGLAGRNNGAVSSSYATGNVSGDGDNIGGLVGRNNGTVSASYATSDVNGLRNNIGGLAGNNSQDGTVSASYATGSVRGSELIGGLIGYNDGTVSANYATGVVRGDNRVGGLIGQNQGGEVRISYSTARVIGAGDNVGGLIGRFVTGIITANYYDADTAGVRIAVGSDDTNRNGILDGLESGTAGAELKRTSELQLPTDYSGIYENWGDFDVDGDGTADALWELGTNTEYPVLRVDVDSDQVIDRWYHFGYQGRERVALTLRKGSGSFTLGWSAIHTSYPRAFPSTGYVIYRNGQVLNEVTTPSYVDTEISEDISYIYQVAQRVAGGTVGRSNFASEFDSDGDRLVEISNLEQLSAIRYDLNGDGVPESNGDIYQAAFPSAPTNMAYSSVGYVGYELTRDLDFATTNSYAEGVINAEWREGQGWSPIGFALNDGLYTAQFEGNGHQIANLYIARAELGLGLFSGIGEGGVIHDIGIVSAEVRGGNVGDENSDAGILAGVNQGLIKASHTSGTVSATGLTIGGLAGYNDGMVLASHSSAMINGVDGEAGGLVGNNRGTVRNSYASGQVESTGSNIGGLVGMTNSESQIIASSATGNVSGNRDIGGLVGDNRGLVRNSYASGRVEGSGENVGGLIGGNYTGGRVIASYATGDVDGDGSDIGGLVGDNRDEIHSSYATGNVEGKSDIVGGIVGLNNLRGTISSSYATGDVVGLDSIGGLVGQNFGIVSASYATGIVRGGNGVGGLIGENANGEVRISYSTARVIGEGYKVGGLIGRTLVETITANYYDADTSGMQIAIGSDDINRNGVLDGSEEATPGATRKRTSELQLPTSYTGIYTVWDDYDIDGDNVPDVLWEFGTSSEYPVLRVDADGDQIIDEWYDFGYQIRERVTLAVTEGFGTLALGWSEANTIYPRAFPSTGYVIYRNDEVLAELTARTYVDTGLSGDTPYTYQIAQRLAGGTVGRSNLAEVTLGSDTRLTELRVEGVELTPTFSSATTIYQATVTQETVTIHIQPNDRTVRIAVNGVSLSADNLSTEVALQIGSNPITVEVTPSSQQVQEYVLEISREIIPSVRLTELRIGGDVDITLTPDPLIASYSVNVDHDVEQVTVYVAIAEPSATLQFTYNGEIFAPINAMQASDGTAIILQPGANVLIIEITGLNQMTQQYTLQINRAIPPNLSLRELRIDGAELQPMFSSATLSYQTDIPLETTQVTIHAVANSADAQVMINGIIRSSVTLTLLAQGGQVIIDVIAPDGTTQAYSVQINRVSSAIRIRLRVFIESLMP